MWRPRTVRDGRSNPPLVLAQAGRDVVGVAAGAVRLLPLRGDRLQLCEVQRQAHLSGLAETGAGRPPHHQMGELSNGGVDRRCSGQHAEQRHVW